MNPSLTFAYPGDIDLPTGGYGYDRKLVAGLRELGWTVTLMPLGDGFPNPTDAALAQAETILTGLPDDKLVMVDSLAFGVMDQWARQDAKRLRIVALVHHPLSLETGLSADARAAFERSEKAALAEVRHVVVTSPATRDLLIEGFGKNADDITVAVPGTDRGPRSAGDGEPPLILSIGSLISRKGHDVLIDALGQLTDLAWTCRIVGSKALDPTTAEALQKRIDDNRLGERISLVGTTADPRAALAQADIFALASRYEGYGMVFAEALAQGVPIVACRAGAIPDVVPQDAGLLVAPDDPAAFADALRSLLGDPKRRRVMAEAAFEAGARLPGWADTARLVSRSLEAIA